MAHDRVRRSSSHPFALLVLAVAVRVISAELRECPFKQASRKLRETLRSQVGRDKTFPDKTICGLDEEKQLLNELQLLTGTSDLTKSNIAGVQDSDVADEPVIINWGCIKDREVQHDLCNKFKYQKSRRTISGACNNLKEPTWGAASVKQMRLVKASYADGYNEPRGGWSSAKPHCCTGSATAEAREDCANKPDALLPNPRLVRKHFHKISSALDSSITALFPIFGQFLDHDITLTPESHNKDCCEYMKDEECFVMTEVYEDTCQEEKECSGRDKRSPVSSIFDLPSSPADKCKAKTCYELTRSVEHCGSGTNHKSKREQLNAITSFIDASAVYGSDPVTHEQLRVENSALMRDFEGLMPDINSTHATAGDVRSSENPQLLAFHTVFLREHNRLVMDIERVLALRRDSREFDVDFVFEKARELVIAQLQAIVYYEFLPILLGNDTMNKPMRRKRCVGIEARSKYMGDVNPGIINEFAGAAYRIGHTLVRGDVLKYSLAADSEEVGEYLLKDNFFNTSEYMADDNRGWEQILNGLSRQACGSSDPLLDVNLADHLFENLNGFGDDLGARNIQRGRDHGIAGYNEYREHCGMKRVCSWTSRPKEIEADKWTVLSELYDHPSDIDLFTAGLAETPDYNGGIVGRTFNCIIQRQFYRLKHGDRFFFNHLEADSDEDLKVKRFTDEQVAHIMNRRLFHLLCDNTGIMKMREQGRCASIRTVQGNTLRTQLLLIF